MVKLIKFLVFISLTILLINTASANDPVAPPPAVPPALVKTDAENIALTCDFPTTMVDGSAIPDGTLFLITLYASSDQNVWFKIAINNLCKFDVSAKDFNSGIVWFSVTATVDDVESDRSNRKNVSINKTIIARVSPPVVSGLE